MGVRCATPFGAVCPAHRVPPELEAGRFELMSPSGATPHRLVKADVRDRIAGRYRTRHGGPRQAVVGIDASAARLGGSAWMTRQCPILQFGQQSISMSATRRMMARAASMACVRVVAAGIASGRRASAARWVLAAGARSPYSCGCS
jgi:hypothetical protein